MTQHIYSIEGNIGSGKSTVIKLLKDRFYGNKDIHFLLEPVSEWESITDENGDNIIEKYYENQEKYAFSFQMMAYITRLSQLKQAIKKGYKYIVTERSLMTDKMVFAKLLYYDKKIDNINYEIYNRWFNEFIAEIPNINYIYIRTTPEIAEQRVINRSRPGENIQLSYLQQCHDYHELWMNEIKNEKNIIVNGNDDITDELYNTEIIDKIISHINVEPINHHILMFNGSSSGNPGPAGCGYVIYDSSYRIVYEGSHSLGRQTNNYAEYMGFILGVKKVRELKISHLNVKGDSLLVINQLNGSYSVKLDTPRWLYNEAKEILHDFENIQYTHVKRSNNCAANELANCAIDDQRTQF
jgi:deoxyadenosine/deoxycytidine kinase/ribonuclease HI